MRLHEFRALAKERSRPFIGMGASFCSSISGSIFHNPTKSVFPELVNGCIVHLCRGVMAYQYTTDLW